MEGSSYNEDLKPRISKVRQARLIFQKKENQGITMRCIESIFEAVENLRSSEGENQRKYTIECSYMQIY